MTELQKTAQKLVELAKSKQITIATAESCTGGMASSAITDISGSSQMLDRGFVTYSNEAKMEMLGVKKATLDSHGAVSPQVAEEMAFGAAMNSRGVAAISITGIAGPNSDDTNKPVGLVYFGFYDKRTGKALTEKQNFEGDRHEVRRQSALRALEILIENI